MPETRPASERIWNIDETGEIQRFNRSRQPPFPTVPSILSRSLERRTRDELSISGSDVSASRIRSGTNGYRLTQIDKRQGCAFGSRFTGEKIRVYVTGDEFTGESWKGGGVAIRFNDGRSEAPLFDSTKNHFELLGYIYTYTHTPRKLFLKFHRISLFQLPLFRRIEGI